MVAVTARPHAFVYGRLSGAVFIAVAWITYVFSCHAPGEHPKMVRREGDLPKVHDFQHWTDMKEISTGNYVEQLAVDSNSRESETRHESLQVRTSIVSLPHGVVRWQSKKEGGVDENAARIRKSIVRRQAAKEPIAVVRETSDTDRLRKGVVRRQRKTNSAINVNVHSGIPLHETNRVDIEKTSTLAVFSIIAILGYAISARDAITKGVHILCPNQGK